MQCGQELEPLGRHTFGFPAYHVMFVQCVEEDNILQTFKVVEGNILPGKHCYGGFSSPARYIFIVVLAYAAIPLFKMGEP